MERVALTNPKGPLSLRLVNRLFFDVANSWIWRDVTFLLKTDFPSSHVKGRLNTLFTRLDQGTTVTNLFFLSMAPGQDRK